MYIGGMMSFKRNCPQCGKELSYSTKGSLTRAIKNNKPCMSCSQRAKTLSDETKRKLSKALQGHTHSEETKRKMSKSRKGRTFSKEHKKNMSKAQKGRTLSEETRIKMSLAQGGNGILDKDKFNHSKLIMWARDVKERDDNVCCCCGSTEELHAHHIFYKGIFPELAYVQNNGVTLCKSCHILEHKINNNIFSGGFDVSER